MKTKNQEIYPIIEINHLIKKYGDFEAVKDLSFEVKKGEIFAFL